jgi:hypothetical protein
MVHDDEYCANPEGLGQLIWNFERVVQAKGGLAGAAGKPKPSLYGGVYLWKGTEYRAMKGPDGMLKPERLNKRHIISR